MLPTQPETIAIEGPTELQWWSGVRSDGTISILSNAVKHATGQDWALVGNFVIAVAYVVKGLRKVTLLFSDTQDCRTNLYSNAKNILQGLIYLDTVNDLPPDQSSQLF